MTTFVIRRLGSVVPVLLLVAIFAFLLVHITPGDPASYMLGPLASEQQVHDLREVLGLNEPVYVQFKRWFVRVLHGDLGESIFMSIPVPLAIWQRLEPTLLLTLLAVLVEVLVGVSAGIAAATHRNTWIDQAIMTFASLGLSTPSFWARSEPDLPLRGASPALAGRRVRPTVRQLAGCDSVPDHAGVCLGIHQLGPGGPDDTL